MSAAEKLKGLAASMEDSAAPDYKAAIYAHIRYREALPQIVAVVEAAAASSSHHDYWLSEATCSLCAALAALDEALT